MSFAHSLKGIISVPANHNLCTAEVRHLLQFQQAWQHIHALQNGVHIHFRTRAMPRANEQDEKHIGCHVAVSEDLARNSMVPWNLRQRLQDRLEMPWDDVANAGPHNHHQVRANMRVVAGGGGCRMGHIHQQACRHDQQGKILCKP